MAGANGEVRFDISLANLGSLTSPTTPTSIYNLIFGTGQDAASPGTEVDTLLSPVAVGGAAVSDVAPWSLFDSGDAIFLSAISNSGIGGCVGAAPIDGFGQAANTCGTGQMLLFSFITPRRFNPAIFTLLNYEVLELVDGIPAESCGGSECIVLSATPEPTSLILTATGLLVGIGVRSRRRAPNGLSRRLARRDPTC
jgi:hypothetical protein